MTFRYSIYACISLLLMTHVVNAQKPSFTANSTVPAYSQDFYFGTNPGYYGGYNNNATNDKIIHDLFPKAGMHTSRLALYDWFLQQYGPNVRKSEFQYYTATLGMKELTLFLNDPSDDHRAKDSIVCVNGSKTERFRSFVFKNLYAPIWDDSTNGITAINDTNYYAAYVYKVVKNYGQYIRFYEVWNEPDYAANGNVAKASGDPGNWWDANPAPCDLVNLRTDITNYVRMLRITYEVVKSMYPNSYVATGGIGYENFLDAVLRNTDNPNNGAVSSEYPLKGGAYFDVLSYHMYPQYSLRSWNNNTNGFNYHRHSDEATKKVIEKRDVFQTILAKYGYNGTTSPKKHYIITEVNIPRKRYGSSDLIGSDEAQRNFLMKTFVKCQKEGIKQVYTYALGESKDINDANANTDGFDAMGFYENLNKATPATAKLTPSGVGCKSLSDFTLHYVYDVAATAALNLPSTLDGAAFTKNGETKYVLWVKTTTDLSETASKSYTFPTSLKVQTILSRSWDYVTTKTETTINGSSVTLTAAPTLLAVTLLTELDSPFLLNNETFTVYPNPAQHIVYVSRDNHLKEIIGYELKDTQGRIIYTKTSSEATVSFETSSLPKGIYLLEIKSQSTNKVVKKIIVE